MEMLASKFCREGGSRCKCLSWGRLCLGRLRGRWIRRGAEGAGRMCRLLMSLSIRGSLSIIGIESFRGRSLGNMFKRMCHFTCKVSG